MGLPENCQKNTLIVVNAIIALFALAAWAYSVAIIAQDGLLGGAGIVIPVVWAWGIFGLTLGIVLLSVMAIVAAVKHIRPLLIFMITFTWITFAITIFVTIVLALWSNNQELGELAPLLRDMENALASFVTSWAFSKPLEWYALQDRLDCCGVSFEKMYVVPTNSTILLTGPDCDGPTNTALAGIVTLYTTYNQTAQDLANSASIKGEKYFCQKNAKSTIANYTIQFGVAMGVLAFLQALSASLAIYLLCGVREEEGGFAEVDENNEIVSPVKTYIAPAVSAATAVANRISMNIKQPIQHTTNRISMNMGFSPIFSPPPGMGPPGMGSPNRGAVDPFGDEASRGGPIFQQESKALGGGGNFGPEYDKYKKMLKSGLPEGAVRNAFARDQVEIPAGFFETFGSGGGDEESQPVSKGRQNNVPAPPPSRSMASAVTATVSRAANRMSMNLKSLMGGGGGGGMAPPAPPVGFGELPPEGAPRGGAYGDFGASTNNPTFGGGGGGSAMVASLPEEFASPPPPKMAQPVKAPAPAKAAPAKKEAPPKKAAAAKAAPAKKAGGGGGPGFLADIAGAGGTSAGPAAFGLKKTVTNDRSAPNLNLKG